MSVPIQDRRYLGIDVGTGSARAGVFDAQGRMLAAATRDIQVWRPQTDFVEQSSEDIWSAVCAATRQALADAGARPEQIRGVGFDATCSLVALDARDRPVTLSPSGADAQNVIVWMDHRALDPQARINATGHDVLRYVGGAVSVEMQTPKLLWIKENLPESWRRAARFFDLPDYLTYRATGDDTRSLCSTVCKWTYLGHERPAGVGAWSASFFAQAGLGDLAADGFRRIGSRVRPLGEAVGAGLSANAARELGLRPGTPVGVSSIDAHAGGIGVIGAALQGKATTPEDLERRLALICGTSSCHMAVSAGPRFTPGVWGPYFSAMVPGLWLNEGGQSATGALLDHVIDSHAQAADLRRDAQQRGLRVYDLLNERLDHLAAGARLAEGARPAAELTRDLHVLPYFHGNRSPRADASLRGVISGLRLGATIDDLALLYLATTQAIAYGARHIVAALNERGYRIDTLLACGGLTKNPRFLREHADATGCTVVLPREPEAVLLGGAILGAVAAADFDSVVAAMSSMSAAGETIAPRGGRTEAYHEAKYRVFHRMFEEFQACRRIMSGAGE